MRTAILIVQFYFTLTTKEVVILGLRVRLYCALALLILAYLIQLEARRKVLTRIALALSHAEVCVRSAHVRLHPVAADDQSLPVIFDTDARLLPAIC